MHTYFLRHVLSCKSIIAQIELIDTLDIQKMEKKMICLSDDPCKYVHGKMGISLLNLRSA
jgi:hypothetical protein